MEPVDDHVKAMAARDPYGALGLEDDSDLAFAGIRPLRRVADFCERYQVQQLRQAGHMWAEIAGWVGVSAQALHRSTPEPCGWQRWRGSSWWLPVGAAQNRPTNPALCHTLNPCGGARNKGQSLGGVAGDRYVREGMVGCSEWRTDLTRP